MLPILGRPMHFFALLAAFDIGVAQAETVFQDGFEPSTACVLNPDPADADFFGEFCDGSECVYVSSTGSASGDGSAGLPFETIQEGISTALGSDRTAVCVASGVYDGTVIVPQRISLYGGFNPIGLARSDVPTTLRAPGTVVEYPQLQERTWLAGFAIEATAPDGDRSTYGVRVLAGGGELRVMHTTFDVAAGATGLNGANGSPHLEAAPSGNDGHNGCASCSGFPGGSTAPVCAIPGGTGGLGGFNTAQGDPGIEGSAGASGGAGGAASPLCFELGGAGGPGGDGETGAAGEPGGGGGGSLRVLDAGYLPRNGEAGSVGGGGTSGGGGGGGGGGITSGICNADRGGGGGTGGCGGVPGDFGRGGGGGGASLGILALSGSLLIENSSMNLGGGGTGGLGGNGGNSQAGGTGGAGGNGADDGGRGGPGGNGESGGHGGPGGGGAGGPVACIARFAAVQVATNALVCNLGPGGTGGQGGTNTDGTVAGPGTSGPASVQLLLEPEVP